MDRTVAGFGEFPAAATLVGLALLLLVGWVTLAVTRRWLLRLIEKGIRRTKGHWDDAFLDANVLRRAAWLAPVLVAYYGIELVPHVSATAGAAVQRLCLALMAIVAMATLSGILTAVNTIYSTFPVSRGRPIKGYLQIVKMFVYLLGGVFVIALLLNRSPLVFVTGIGAMTAVLLLIFRDTILSFVASIQIASNDMVRIGDWIQMPKYDADGDVVDVALHTIKVQNWDKTITTIPTYKLIEESFRNWRGMTESGGRRIKRSLFLDMNTIHFLSEEEIQRFARFYLLQEYMATKLAELEEYNRGRQSADVVANARRLTNVGTFRAYVVAYLRQHPQVHSDGMTFLIRQLQPTSEGLPIEIYVFAKDVRWVPYEGIQADIFDHLLAIVPEFGLRVFQKPSGHDVAQLGAGRLATG